MWRVPAALVAGGEDESPAGPGIVDGLLARADDILHSAAEHHLGGVEVALEHDLVAVEPLELGEVAVAHRRPLERIDDGEIGLFGEDPHEFPLRPTGMDMGPEPRRGGELYDPPDSGKRDPAEHLLRLVDQGPRSAD